MLPPGHRVVGLLRSTALGPISPRSPCRAARSGLKMGSAAR
jgi:hypothetical protein